MDTETLHHDESRTETGQSTSASSNVALAGTQQQRRHLLVHPKAANAATNNVTENAHLNIIPKPGSSKNMK